MASQRSISVDETIYIGERLESRETTTTRGPKMHVSQRLELSQRSFKRKYPSRRFLRQLSDRWSSKVSSKAYVNTRGWLLIYHILGVSLFISLVTACGGEYGQRPLPGQWVTIASGDRLSKIADEHRVPLEDIIEINGIRDPDRILVGQRLFIPQFARDLSSQRTSDPIDDSQLIPDDQSQDELTLSERPGFKAVGGVNPQNLSEMTWPLTLSLLHRVALSSGYGMRGGKLHRGLDVRAPSGTPVRAALGGEVTRSEVSSGGYGKVVYLRHSGGIETRYAHHRKNLVKVGQIVRAGDIIAEVGSSGRSTNPHLHFEVRVRGEAIDPLLVLPALAAE